MNNSFTNVLIETAAGINQIKLKDELLDERKVFLSEQVDSETVNEIMQQLMYLEKKDNTKPIVFFVDSPGGKVDEGMALYDFIEMMKSPVITVCTSKACSMGAILFLAGDKRIMFKHSEVMIHDASFGNADFSGLKPDEIIERTKHLSESCDMLRNLIAERTGRPLDEVIEKMKQDSYFKAEEALEFGLATDIASNLEEII